MTFQLSLLHQGDDMNKFKVFGYIVIGLEIVSGLIAIIWIADRIP